MGIINEHNLDFKNDENSDDKSFSVIADIHEDSIAKDLSKIVERDIPILPLRNMVLFPTTAMPVTVGRTSSLNLIKSISKTNGYAAVFCQRKSTIDRPDVEDLYPIGTLARVLRTFEMPDNTTTVILQGVQKVGLVDIVRFSPFTRGKVEIIEEGPLDNSDPELNLLADNCCKAATEVFKAPNEGEEVSIEYALKNLITPAAKINFLCTNFKSSITDRVTMLEECDYKEKGYFLLSLMDKEIQLQKLQSKIVKRTHKELEEQQKEYFLQQQIKNIQEELGGSVQDQDVTELRAKADKKEWSRETEEIFSRELAKLERINPQTPDYHVQLNYLQLFVSLPWGKCTTDNLDIQNARKVLDRDHYGLDKVKERILEHLAVIKMRGDLKSPILCLYGPPGVGKTSLGRSIASALKREYVRMSLGGLHDESEIRGHRRTYIGAMPGRILKNLAKAGSDNPVFILDEIDKVGQASTHGDPSSALLEVLDPEQNNSFHDNFLDTDYDLSKVMFIATANNLSNIPAPLLDRMELIEVSGYLTEEKIEIAKRHLVPKEKEAVGIAKEKVTLNKAAIERVVEDYTRESGVRSLQKKIGKIMRKLATKIASTGSLDISTIKPSDLPDYLGPKEYSRDIYQGNEYAGVVVGLAWTAVGGEILYIETSLSRGKGDKITLTGNLGDVMKESAMLAHEYIKAHASHLQIPAEIFDKWDIHIHVPEGAIPKDGPSAGITMATALASALTQRKVKPNLAMTGEITLRGKVLPVGGIKEKILAAKRAGIKEIILCKENKRNIDVIPDIYLQGLTFHYVSDIKEVFDIALLREKVDNPVNLNVQ